MPVHHGLEGLPQRGRVQRPRDAHDHGHLVDEGLRGELLEEPDVLLAVVGEVLDRGFSVRGRGCDQAGLLVDAP